MICRSKVSFSFNVINSCSQDFLNIGEGGLTEFWEINKYFLNYLNAVYSYKEFINSYSPSIKDISNRYYYKQRWYRFVCDYRNRVIHQSTIIKNRNPSTGDIYIDYMEIRSIQEKIIQSLKIKLINETEIEKKDNIKKQLTNATRILTNWDNLIGKDPIMIQGKPYKSMKEIIQNANAEIYDLHNDILSFVFENAVKTALKKLLSWSHKDNEYHYTFIVNKALSVVYEPMYVIEDFYKVMLMSLGKNHCICQKIKNLLSDNHYIYSYYKQKCSLEEFIEKYNRET